MKYKVTAKKKIGDKFINDWFKGELSYFAYFTDSVEDARKIIKNRIKTRKFYSDDCVPQLIYTGSEQEIKI